MKYALLAGDTHGGQTHDDVLSDHERQLLHDVGVDNLGEHNEAFSDVLQSDQNGVGEKEHLRDVHPAL